MTWLRDQVMNASSPIFTGMTRLNHYNASTNSLRQQEMRNMLTSFFWSGDAIRSRRVSDIVLWTTLDVPSPPAPVMADWQREISTRLALEPGDVEAMPLARTQVRWPAYKRCVQAMSDWTCALGLPAVLADSDMALMACRGARYHHDGEQYGSAAFCNLFLSEDKGLDLRFPSTGQCIPLKRGTAVIFDTGQPHGVIQRAAPKVSLRPTSRRTRTSGIRLLAPRWLIIGVRPWDRGTGTRSTRLAIHLVLASPRRTPTSPVTSLPASFCR
ncbi:hypothetical protein QFZ89_007310 [Paraburkholderia youngii]